MNPTSVVPSQYVHISSNGDKTIVGEGSDNFTFKCHILTGEALTPYAISMQPAAISITNLFDNITSFNDTIIMNISYNGIWNPKPSLYRIPTGTYTGKNLAVMLNYMLAEVYMTQVPFFAYDLNTNKLCMAPPNVNTQRYSVKFIKALGGQVSTAWSVLGLGFSDEFTFFQSGLGPNGNNTMPYTLNVTPFPSDSLLYGEVNMPLDVNGNYIFQPNADAETITADKANYIQFAPESIQLLGPEMIYVSIAGLQGVNVSTGNSMGNRISSSKINLAFLDGIDHNRWLAIPVNAEAGGIITHSWDNVHANALIFNEKTRLDYDIVITLYDQEMRLLHLADGQSVNMSFKSHLYPTS